ncbi:MAG: hypothetical protein PWQ97_72 [Tepidanaerobacteraceae bacterium]|nr:hypothetical protein [Tepidanaerobacteraceae bacterium]
MAKLNKEEILDMVEKNAVEAQKRDDICARSTMYGLKSYFDFIPEEMVTATLSLAGGAGASSGSCGAYCSGLLAVGLKFNPAMAEETTKEGLRERKMAVRKFHEYRDAFLREFGTTLCPELQKKIFGRSFDFLNEKDARDFFAIHDRAEKCAAVVAKATRLAAEMMLEDEE